MNTASPGVKFPIKYPLSSPTEINYRVVKRFSQHLDPPSIDDVKTLDKEDSILLIRLSAIGDAVRSNGFEGTIGIAVQSPIDQILNLWDEIDRVHTINREHLPLHPIKFIRHLKPVRDVQYDWVIDAHGLIKSGLVSRFSGGNLRIGFDSRNSKEYNHLFQDATIDLLPEGLPRILKYLQLVRSFTPNFQFERKNLIPTSPAHPSHRPELTSLKRPAPILVQPRTSHERYGEQKEWGVSNYVTLINRLRDKRDLPGILITWGPGERETADEIASSFDEGVQLAPKTNLAELTYLIEHARLMISPDTATAHLADILGTPLVAIYGGSDYYVNGPMLTDYRLITPRTNETTTRKIPVTRVLPACLDLLENV